MLSTILIITLRSVAMTWRRHDGPVNPARSFALFGTLLCVLLSGASASWAQSAPADSQLLRTKAQEFEARLEAAAGELKDNRHLRDFSQQQREQPSNS
jgi:hypothetical protein